MMKVGALPVVPTEGTVHRKATVPWVSAAKPPRFLVTIKKHHRIQEVPVGSVRFLLKQIAPHQHNN